MPRGGLETFTGLSRVEGVKPVSWWRRRRSCESGTKFQILSTTYLLHYTHGERRPVRQRGLRQSSGRERSSGSPRGVSLAQVPDLSGALHQASPRQDRRRPEQCDSHRARRDAQMHVLRGPRVQARRVRRAERTGWRRSMQRAHVQDEHWIRLLGIGERHQERGEAGMQ